MAELRAELHESQSIIGLPACNVRMFLMSSNQHLIFHDHPKNPVLKVLTQVSMAAFVRECVQTVTKMLGDIVIN